MTTGLLDRLRSTKRTRRQQAVENIRAIAERAAAGRPQKNDDEQLLQALATAELAEDQFAALVDDLRELREKEQAAAELDDLRTLVGASREALRSFDEHRAQQIAEMDQQRAELEREYKAAQARLKTAREAASKADELRVAHADVLDSDARDLDRLDIRLPDGGFGAQGNGLPGASVAVLGRTRYGIEISKRTALRQLAYIERLAAHERRVREWQNGRFQQRLGEAQRERDERVRVGAGVPAELDERIAKLASKIDSPPKRPEMPTWAALVAKPKELARLTSELHTRMDAESLARDEDGYHEITRRLRDEARGGIGRK